jgi:hypothetical protein
MLSNQGGSVNSRDGSHLYPTNFIQHDNQRAHRFASCRLPASAPAASLTLTYYVNQNNDTTIFCGCGDAPDHKP